MKGKKVNFLGGDPKMNFITKVLCVLLMAAMLLPCLAACKPTPVSDGMETESEAATTTETEGSRNEPSELTPEGGDGGELGLPMPLPEDGDGGESGELGEPTPPVAEPDPVKPSNPVKSLFAKSQEIYDGGNLGCTELTVLAEYNRGVAFDTHSYRDHNNKIFYLYLPCRADASSVTFSVTHRDGSQSGPYTVDFSDGAVSDNEHVLGNTSNYAIRVLQSDLPTVMLEMDETYGTVDAMNADKEHETYTYGKLVATVTDEMAKEKGWQTRYESREEDATEHGSMKLRGRGNASWGYPKRPYQLVTENSMSLLGLDRAKKYVLLANYFDAAMMRNALALELGYRFGIDYTPDYRQVDVFLNGEYLGLYMLVEKIEVGEGRVAIDNRDDLLLEKDNFGMLEPEFTFQTPYDSGTRYAFRLHSPETDEGMERAKQIIALAEEALYEGTDAELATYFDLASWAKMYFVQMYMMSSDAYYGSLYFYYNHEDGKLYACSPWDFDYSLGVSYSNSQHYLDPMIFDVQNVEWMKPMLKHDNFVRALLDEYYKNGGREILASVPALADTLYAEIYRSAQMNALGEPVNYYPAKGVTDFDSAVVFLKQIALKREQYMKNKMETMAAALSYEIPPPL